ncbi:ISH9-type transposase ISHwa3 [Natrialba taiwanensis DSM 12281]|uniref:ISH9-type transposase ISHwa3 n=1 Tax=Natrialba taiwanensis DSM 12281 TaxID=1230458 RepID=L9ZMF3_9EURY|nr:ISH9-type transposase ISHwa3 [Natrialba taiwanensis DSM 12281]
MLDLHCSTTLEGSDADLCEQIARVSAGDLRSLAADKGYDNQQLRERLCELDIRPLIKHRIFAPYDHAHNARIGEDRYAQRSMTETVNSAVKRSLGYAVRARTWYREFREIALMCRLQHQMCRHTVKSTVLQRFNKAVQTNRPVFGGGTFIIRE